jgi:FKBP-type peptidyl-prolyl cis-trans isomerase FklB
MVLKTDKDKASYAIGLNVGRNLHRDSVDVNVAALLQGLRDALADRKPLLTDDEAKAALTALQAEVTKNMEAKRKAEGDANKAKGDTFLAANKSRPDVVTLPDGLQYKVLSTGTGPKPVPGDVVDCNYRGTLVDGTEFDSSAKHGNRPAKFTVTGVIKGWTEALQLMPVGSKWQLFIPPSLAYGDRGAGAVIGPDSTLIFEIELVSIEPKPAPATPPAPKQ